MTIASIDDLLRIMAALRDPQTGCPWDVQQDFDTIAPYTIEEAYEVADAIDRRDFADLRDELGDLLLQVVFHARMAEEAGHFRFRRCGRGDLRQDDPPPSARIPGREWKRGKSGKCRGADGGLGSSTSAANARPAARTTRSVLAGIARGLPEWQRALKLQKRASGVGFDWNDPGPVLDKLQEELDEVRHELGAVAARAMPMLARIMRALPTKSATCCSSASISRAWPASTIRRRCVVPMRSSSAASGAWRRWLRPRARPLVGKTLDRAGCLLEPGQGRGQGRPPSS